MKNYLILAMILIAGMTAYPQATRSARESKSEKSSAKKESVQRSESRSESKAPRSRVETRSSEKPQATRSNNESSRSRVETRSTERPQATRSNNESNRSRVETRSAERPQATRSTEATRSGQDQNRVQQNSAQRRVESGNAERRQGTSVTRPENKSGNSENRQGNTITRPENRSGSTRTARENGNSDNRDFKAPSSSASRVYREGKGTLTRDDGTVVRHQNDEVFASRKYKLDYDNYENLRRSDEFRRDYRDYHNWYSHRNIRVINHYHNRYVPVPWEVRRSRYYYRAPHHIDLIWTPLLFHRFMYYYPTHNRWDMEFGSSIETISAYDAQEYAGTVRRVYGKVDEVYYSPEDENYILYIGAPFPYQDISIVIPKYIARDLSMSPKWYFEDEYVWVVGLINMWEGKAEIIVRDQDQIRKY